VEAGSNTFTVTLQAVEGDEKEVSNLREYNMVTSTKGLGPENNCAGKGQQHVQMTEPSSRQRGGPTETRL
jgi:hypothetical protein